MNEPSSSDEPRRVVKARIEPPIGWLLVDRPRTKGALTRVMWEALPERLSELSADERVRVVVIRGTEGNFIAGADISEFRQVRSDPALARRYDEGANTALRVLADAPVPSIAMIEGACVGGGCLVAFGCDLRIAARDARLGIPAAKLGLAYPYEALERLVEVIGEARALDLCLTGRLVTGEEAYATGLVQHLADRPRLEATTRELANRIAANAPLSLRYLRLALRRRSQPRLTRDEIFRLADACFESSDYAEGVAAFLEKRPPRFRGR